MLITLYIEVNYTDGSNNEFKGFFRISGIRNSFDASLGRGLMKLMKNELRNYWN